MCGEEFAHHPRTPHLVALCTKPKGHEGEHDNLLARSTLPAATQEAPEGGEGEHPYLRESGAGPLWEVPKERRS